MWTVLLMPAAEVQADDADGWWRNNRPDAPLLFRQELAAAIDLLETNPLVVPRYTSSHDVELRRWLLPATRYHLYVEIDRARTCARIVAVWSAARERLPR